MCWGLSAMDLLCLLLITTALHSLSGGLVGPTVGQAARRPLKMQAGRLHHEGRLGTYTKGLPRDNQSTGNLHPTHIHPATKVHPIVMSVRDDYIPLMTMSDRDD